MRRINRVVAGVPHIGKARNRQSNRLGVQRNQGRINYQAIGVDGHTLITHPVKQGRSPAVFLLGLEGPIETFRSECVHVGRVVVESGSVEPPLLPVKQAGRVIADQATAGQQTDAGTHGKGLVAPEHIEAGDFQNSVRTDASAALRVVRGRDVAGRKLDATSVAEGPTLGFLEVEEHILGRLPAIGVLDRHVHLVEQTQVVKTTL